MKKLTKTISVMLLILVAAFFFASCNGDPASGGGSGSNTTDIPEESTGAGGDSALVGTWTYTQWQKHENDCVDIENGKTITFNSDGTLTNGSYSGKWDASGGILTFTRYIGDASPENASISVGETLLTIDCLGSLWTCIRESGTAGDIEGTWTVTKQDGEDISDGFSYKFVFKDGKFAFDATFQYSSFLASGTKSYSMIEAGSYVCSDTMCTINITKVTEKCEYEVDGTTLRKKAAAAGYEIFTKQ